MSKRVLLISPTPTHPVTAGNRQVFFSLAREFKKMGFEIHCLYLPLESCDMGAMNNFFEGRLYTFDRSLYYSKQPPLHYYIKRIRRLFAGIRNRVLLATGKIDKDSFKYNGSIDDFLTPYAYFFTKQLAAQKKFDIVVCEYVWISGLLDIFQKNVFKIIDTHDKFGDRFRVLKETGKEPQWVSLYPAEEAKGLKRADLVIALNESERAYFEKAAGNKAILYFDVPDPRHLEKKIFSNTLLYFGSGNDINVASVEYFIENHFEKIRQKIPAVKLLIGGKICEKLTVNKTGIALKGSYDDPGEFYKQGDIVINPELTGTGLKMKALEALSFGLPLIASHAGLRGITQPDYGHYRVAESAEEYVAAISELSANELLREQMAGNASRWLLYYKNKLASELKQNLPGLN
ncbi:MAG: glycosyltransferase family 4 protein [Ferruginibacter sp.]